jgi:hypothetical protein
MLSSTLACEMLGFFSAVLYTTTLYSIGGGLSGSSRFQSAGPRPTRRAAPTAAATGVNDFLINLASDLAGLPVSANPPSPGCH